MDADNEGRPPGVLFSGGPYWKELRRFMLRNLRDFGFGKASEQGRYDDFSGHGQLLSLSCSEFIDDGGSVD